MKLSTFTVLNNSDFDLLEECIQEKNRYIKSYIKLCKDYDKSKKEKTIFLKKGNLKRTFCSCGYVSGKIKDKSCPNCGNINIVNISLKGDVKETLLAHAYIEEEKDKILLKKFSYIIEAISELKFIKKSPETFYEISELNFKEILHYENLDIWDIKEILEIYIKKGWDLKYFNYLNKKTVPNLKKYFETINAFPQYTKEQNLYPNIYDILFSESTYSFRLKYKGFKDFPSYSNLEEFILNEICNKKELLPYVDKLFIPKGYYINQIYNISQMLEDIKSSELYSTIEYMIKHFDINIRSLMIILSPLNDMDKKEEIIYSYFIKDCYILYQDNIYSEFKKRKEFLETYGYPINIGNFDIRNFNILYNQKKIEEENKYNAKKVSFFLEKFDINPLDSLKYLDSRRSPNKQLLEELKEQID